MLINDNNTSEKENKSSSSQIWKTRMSSILGKLEHFDSSNWLMSLFKTQARDMYHGYSILFKKLMEFSEEKIIMALEGGYDLESLANSVLACVEVLLEGKPIAELLMLIRLNPIIGIESRWVGCKKSYSPVTRQFVGECCKGDHSDSINEILLSGNVLYSCSSDATLRA
ncbi:histone deacetylase 5 [Tanacetum coccineum]